MRIRLLLSSFLAFCLIAMYCESCLAQEKIDHNIIIGKLNGYTLVYDCYGCEQSHSDKIMVYAQKDNKRTKLFTYDLANDRYIADVKLVYLLNHPFIYVTASHTYGHFYGDLYAFDIAHLKVKAVGYLQGNIKTKMPDDLEFRKTNGLRFENNKILDGAYYRRNDENWSVDDELQLVRLGNNYYKFKPVKEIITHDEL